MEMKKVVGGGFRRMCSVLNIRVRQDASYRRQTDHAYLSPQGPINPKRTLRI